MNSVIDQIVDRFDVPRRAVVELVETLHRSGDFGETAWSIFAGLRKGGFRIVHCDDDLEWSIKRESDKKYRRLV